MKKIIYDILSSLGAVVFLVRDAICMSTWHLRSTVHSYQHYKLMNNPLDRDAYMAACHRLLAGSKEERVTLHDGEILVLSMR